MSNIPYQLDSSNPNGIVSAPQDSIFNRVGKQYYLIRGSNVQILHFAVNVFASSYKGEVWYPFLTEENASFLHDTEIWKKATPGNNKTGWILKSQNKAILMPPPPEFLWTATILGNSASQAAGGVSARLNFCGSGRDISMPPGTSGSYHQIREFIASSCPDVYLSNVVGESLGITYQEPPTSPTPTPTITPTFGLTPTVTPTPSITPSVTPSISSTPPVTPTPTITNSPSVTPSITPTITATVTPTITSSPEAPATPTPTATPTSTPLVVDLPSGSFSGSVVWPLLGASYDSTPFTYATGSMLAVGTVRIVNKPNSLSYTPIISGSFGGAANASLKIGLSPGSREIVTVNLDELGTPVDFIGNEVAILRTDPTSLYFELNDGVSTDSIEEYSMAPVSQEMVTSDFVYTYDPNTDKVNWVVRNTGQVGDAYDDPAYQPTYDVYLSESGSAASSSAASYSDLALFKDTVQSGSASVGTNGIIELGFTPRTGTAWAIHGGCCYLDYSGGWTSLGSPPIVNISGIGTNTLTLTGQSTLGDFPPGQFINFDLRVTLTAGSVITMNYALEADAYHLTANTKLYDSVDAEITADSLSDIYIDNPPADPPPSHVSGNGSAIFTAVTGGCYRINFTSTSSSGNTYMYLNSMTVAVTNGSIGCTTIPKNELPRAGGMGP